MENWQEVDKQLERAFDTGEVLTASREQLDRWLVALTGRTYEYMKEQTPLLQRLEVVTHLTKVRLDEESLRRRDEQAARSAESARKQSALATRIAVAAIVVNALVAVAGYIWPASARPPQPLGGEPALTTPATPQLPTDPASAVPPPSTTLLTPPPAPAR